VAEAVPLGVWATPLSQLAVAVLVPEAPVANEQLYATATESLAGTVTLVCASTQLPPGALSASSAATSQSLALLTVIAPVTSQSESTPALLLTSTR
jgi:hypothetical protein